MSDLPREATRILEEGTLCYLGAPSPAGPHVTPVVFVLDGGRVWGTTGRGTTKAKLWRADPVAGGLVGSGDSWLTFRGPVTLYDALNPSTWPVSILRSPRVASASFRFTKKNARFFAGYARDARRVPFAWTPPGRVIFSVGLESGARILGGEIVERWGSWGDGITSSGSFRDADAGLAVDDLPFEVRALLDRPGEGTVGLASERGPVVLPAERSGSASTPFARLRADLLSLVGEGHPTNASLVIDRASAWRAAKMRGVLLRGPFSTYIGGKVRQGREELAKHVGELPEEAAAIRIRPRSAVWWSGWASGTVRPS